MSSPAEVARTQREVDVILSGADPAAEPRVPRPWTLARSAVWSHAQRARLNNVCGRFASALEVHLAAVIQEPARVVPSGLESIRAAEVVGALESPTAAFAVRVPGAGGPQGLIDFGGDMALEWVERMLGGAAASPTASRTLTAFEQALLKSLAERTLALFGESWGTPEPARFECGPFQSDPRLAPLSPDEPMLVAHFEIALGGPRRDLLLALPLAAIGTFGLEIPTAAEAGNACARIAAQLRRAEAEVRVRFPEMRLGARALSSLRAGQVLSTRHPTDGTFEVRVNGRMRFRGQIGQVRRQLGVRICENVNEAEGGIVARPLEGRIV